MFEKTPVRELAHQISFAVFRVVRLVRNKKLRTELEGSAVDLVRDLSEEPLGELDRLVSLARSVGEMNEINASVLHREINNLYVLMSAQDAKTAVKEEVVYLADIFSDSGDSADSDENNHSANAEIDKKVDIKTPNKKKKNSNAEERQAEILEYIRKFPSDCRMKHLSAEFSEVSERTLRNDIQVLIEGGLMNRLGGKSGPSSYFVVIDENHDAEVESTDRILLPEATSSN